MKSHQVTPHTEKSGEKKKYLQQSLFNKDITVICLESSLPDLQYAADTVEGLFLLLWSPATNMPLATFQLGSLRLVKQQPEVFKHVCTVFQTSQESGDAGIR